MPDHAPDGGFRRSESGRATALRGALIDDRDGPLPAMLIAFTMLAGIVDAVSILSLNHVFVAAMTGNLLFLGLGIAGAGGFSVAAAAVALGGFVVGVLTGAHVCRHSGRHRGRAVRDVTMTKAVLAVPAVILVVIAGDHLGTGVRYAVTVLLAVSMGSQLALIRFLKVPDLLTAVLTLTMTGVLTERRKQRTDPAPLRRVLALVAFATGAIVAGFLIRFVSVGAALGVGLVIIVSVGLAAHLVSSSEAAWSAAR